VKSPRADSALRVPLHAMKSVPSRLAIGVVWIYRYTFGLLFPASCKYHPSCSQYAIDALRRYGLARGAVLAAWRLLRCNPWSHGGVDRAEDQRLFAA
jgi:uncharacterized protein